MKIFNWIKNTKSERNVVFACPEVNAHYLANRKKLDLDWLTQHIPSCPVCQEEQRKAADMFRE